MRSRILLGTLFGAAAGFVGFLLQEALVPHNPGLNNTLPDMARIGMFVGTLLGIGVGAVEGVAVGSPRLLLRGAILGGIIGAIGGIAGIIFGSHVFTAVLFGKDPDTLSTSGNILDFTHLVLARALGWTFLGALPGLAAGAATLSRKRTLHGLIGGLIGGFLGGLLFDLVASLVGYPAATVAAAPTGQRVVEIGGLSRAIGFTAIGLFTGFFIGLVEEFFKQAWVRVLAGRNEGKDYIISKPLTVLGKDERADIPLFGDPNLAPQHAAIRMENGRHLLLDGGTQVGALVNGQNVQQQLLRDGDMIQLGQMRLLFREKATASKVGRPLVDAPKTAQSPGVVSMPAHLCPFCGAQKDAQGNCLCSVPGAAPSPGAPTPQLPPPQGTYGAPDPYGGVPPMEMGPAQTQLGWANGGIAPAGATGTRLTGLEGPYAGQVFPLSLPTLSIGRDPSKDLPLAADTTVSRTHAHISNELGQHVLYDDGSSNGTYVNNVRVAVQTLAPGDVVQFGSSKFRYE